MDKEGGKAAMNGAGKAADVSTEGGAAGTRSYMPSGQRSLRGWVGAYASAGPG